MTITSNFDYNEIFIRLQQKGRRMFGKHFFLYKRDIGVLAPIAAWMLQDEVVAAQFRIDLNKGIFLTGPIGTGKTRIMELLGHLAAPTREYKMQSCPEIPIDFSKRGAVVLGNYTYFSFKRRSNIPINYCFDDLGKEINTKYYGTGCEMMKSIMLSRYELFIKHGMLTHATSSLSTLEIEQRYGKDVRSRLREMFNKISFPNDAKDKRKND
jgi:energy-coupling factor transporter ATP-binding protein EcfA2